MSGVKLFGCVDPAVGSIWIPVAVNADGEIIASGSVIERADIYETWQLEAIDPAIWVAGGTAAVPFAVNAPLDYPWLTCRAIPAALETARLRSVQRWPVATNLWDVNHATIQTGFSMTFELILANVANIDNTHAIFGLVPDPVNTRNSNNIIGFALTGDALQTVTDSGGVEETNTGFGETLTNHNKFKIESNKNVDYVNFYLNGTLIATHTNVLAVPVQLMYLMFYIETEAGGGATIGVGQVAVWTDVELT